MDIYIDMKSHLKIRLYIQNHVSIFESVYKNIKYNT